MKKLTAILMVSLLLLSGCGKESDEISAYKDYMDSFTTDVLTTASQIDAIDPESAEAAEQTLLLVDGMKALFADAVIQDIPRKFENTEDLLSEANEYMIQASDYLHQALDTEVTNISYAKAAGECYNRAMKRISYIASIYQGEIPEGEDIVITYEYEEPDWNLEGETESVIE